MARHLKFNFVQNVLIESKRENFLSHSQ